MNLRASLVCLVLSAVPLACSVQLGGGPSDGSNAASKPGAPERTKAEPKKADKATPRAPATREVFRGQVAFTEGMLVLDARGKKTLDDLAALLNAHPEYTRITADGHCAREKGCCNSEATCKDTNTDTQLANWRANVIRNEMADRGIPRGQVDFEHKGWGHLVKTEADATKHRRTEFVVYGP